MKKLFIFLLCSFYSLFSFSQKDSIVNDIEFKTYIYMCLDSFEYINPSKHSSMKGIAIKLDKKGILKSFNIGFEKDEIKLNRKEYKWLFNLFDNKNYYTYALKFYGIEDWQKSNQISLKIRYNR